MKVINAFECTLNRQSSDENFIKTMRISTVPGLMMLAENFGGVISSLCANVSLTWAHSTVYPPLVTLGRINRLR